MPEGRSRWSAACLVLGLSILLPGTGRFYLRHYRRAVVCSLVFLLGVLPAAVFAFLVASSFTWKSLYWIAFVVVTFGIACALGPLLVVLRRDRSTRSDRKAAQESRPPPRNWALGAYVGAGVLLAIVEAVVFVAPALQTARVESSALEPLLSQRESVTLLVSPYLHPVHGDVVLFRVSMGTASATKLGRVLAEENDLIEARDGHLHVNGVLLDLSRVDQAWLLAKAGRAERRRRALRSLLKPVAMFIPGLGEEVVQNVVRWDDHALEPSYVPEGSLLVLPDWEQESVVPAEATSVSEELPPAGGGHRPRWAILVRRQAIVGRMIF